MACRLPETTSEIGADLRAPDSAARMSLAHVENVVAGKTRLSGVNYSFWRVASIKHVTELLIVVGGRFVPVNAATNRISTGGYTYDADGNLTAIPNLITSASACYDSAGPRPKEGAKRSQIAGRFSPAQHQAGPARSTEFFNEVLD